MAPLMKKHPADEAKESVVRWGMCVMTCLVVAKMIWHEVLAFIQ